MPGAIEKVKMYLNKRDKFTGLYNRNYFFYCLGQKKNGTFIKIKFMGINFINLNSGIKTGDEIIQHISKTLKNIRANCIASRLSGTKFGLYTEEIEINYIRQIIEEIITITNSISNNSDNIKVSASIGAVIYNNNDFSIKDASNKLEISLSNCIRKGNNKYEIYNEKYEPHINIESIEKSIESGEITLYYQPKVDVKSKKIKGVEALIRWFDE
ncbi:diguanylate cyclase domain-containing protein, partial [Clostridium tertium]